MKKGFTLLELLVVIAVIGILASVVMVSLSNARNKADMAVVASAMDSIRKEAELYNSNNNRYGAPYTTTPTSIGINLGANVVTYYKGQNPPPCFDPSFYGNSNVLTIMDQIFSKSKSSVYGGAYPVVFCGMSNDGQSWAFSAVELGGSYKNYCIDSSGQTKQNNNAPTANSIINNATMKCV